MRKNVLWGLLFVVLLPIHLVFGAAGAGLLWGSQTFKFFDETGTSPGDEVPWSQTSGAIGAFAQLIWCGDDGKKDAFVASGTGVSDDDEVRDVWYSSGSGTYTQGKFALQDPGFTSDAYDGKYYVRVYNMASPSWSGNVADPIPTAGGAYYYESATTYTWSYDDSLPAPTYDISGGSNQQTLTPVPEPTTMALFGLGLLTVAAKKRFRK